MGYGMKLSKGFLRNNIVIQLRPMALSGYSFLAGMPPLDGRCEEGVFVLFILSMQQLC